MKKYFFLIFIAFCFVFSALNANASFYDDFLSDAIAKCPGFIGGSSELEVSTPFSRWSTGQHRFKSTCITPFRSNREETSAESKEGNPEDTPNEEAEHTEDDNECIAGSIIRPNSGTVGEFLPVSGAPFSLMYSTDRVKGRKGHYQVNIPVHDSSGNVEAYNIYASYAGGRILDLDFENNYSSLENKKFTFVWDGKDNSGDVVLGSIEFDFTVTITAHGKEIPVTYENVVGTFDAQTVGFGLWTPSIYHFYDVVRQRLFRGSGTTEKLTARTLGNGDLMVASSDESEFYVFDSDGRHLYTKYGLTGADKYTFTYNGSDELTSITGPYSQTTKFTRTNGLVTQITAPKGQITTLTYDSRGYLQSVVNEQDETFEMGYYEGGLISSFKKPEGQSSHFYYNESGNLTKDVHSSGYFTDIDYDFDSNYVWNINTSTTPSGYESKHFVDNITDGNRSMNTITENPLGFRTEIRKQEYNTVYKYPTYTRTMSQNRSKRFPESAKIGGSDLTSIDGVGIPSYTTQSVDFNDPDDPFDFNTMTIERKLKDKTSTAIYNASTKTWTTTTPEGRQTFRTINNDEQTTSLQIGNYLPASMTYKTDGRLNTIEQGKRKTKFSYDTNGYLKGVTNALGQLTIFENDEEGRPVRQITPDNRVIEFNYDKNGKTLAITPPGRPEHNFLYNAFEEVQSYVPPELVGFEPQTVYQYNKDKQIVKKIRPDGDILTYGYDSSSGLLETINTTALGNIRTFFYNDDTNKLFHAAGTDGVTTQFTFHGPLVESINQTGLIDSVILSRAFDDEHRIKNRLITTTQESSKDRLVYDKDDLLVRNGPLVIERENPQGLVTKLRINNVEIHYEYDPQFGELSGIKYFFNSELRNSIEYKRDLLGRISSQTVDGQFRGYLYDESGRLIGSYEKDSKDLLFEYVYDENGNRTNTITPSGEVAATYDDQDRLLTWGDYSYTYNENGELEKKTDTSTSDETDYEYDLLGNLTEVELPDSSIHAYKIDGLDRRVLVYKGGSLQERFLYESQLRVVANIDSSQNINHRYLYADSPNAPEAMVYNGTIYLFYKDARGSILKVINTSTGETAQELTYDDWGKVLSDSNPGFQPFGYAGGLYDSDTGLVRFGARDYDAGVGRWTTKDPILFKSGSYNFFMYVGGDPINKIDPNGLAECFYSISSGHMTCIADNGEVSDQDDYVSGNGFAQNDPGLTFKTDEGAIPMGDYEWCGQGSTSTRRNLCPAEGTDTQGRTNLQTHPCSNKETCSHGCIGGNVKELHELIDSEPGSTLRVGP